MSAADRGLLAVRRVREVREVDARVGLARARAEEARHRAVADRLDESLDAGSRSPAQLSGAELVSRRTELLRLGAAVAEAIEAADAAGRVSESARAHWQVAHTRTRTIDALLERRAQARRDAERRAEARDLDDIAGQAWLRRRAGRDR